MRRPPRVGCTIAVSASMPADPAGARVVGAMAAKDRMDLFDQTLGAIDLIEREEIAVPKRIGPQVTLWWRAPDHAGAFGESAHQRSSRAMRFVGSGDEGFSCRKRGHARMIGPRSLPFREKRRSVSRTSQVSATVACRLGSRCAKGKAWKRIFMCRPSPTWPKSTHARRRPFYVVGRPSFSHCSSSPSACIATNVLPALGAVHARARKTMWPVARAFFPVFFTHSLAEELDNRWISPTSAIAGAEVGGDHHVVFAIAPGSPHDGRPRHGVRPHPSRCSGSLCLSR